MLDVNGTRYHLILGDDWEERCHSPVQRQWEYDPTRKGVCLQAEVFQFQQRGATPLTPDARRGAAQDAYGHWYWLDDTATQILAQWRTAPQPVVLFPRPPATAPATSPGTFHPVAVAPAMEPEPLAGLAVTPTGYLVVGSPTTGSLLVFDLYAFDGGFLRVALPSPPAAPGDLTAPFDLAALPDGGILVLDRQHKLIWRLDTALRPGPVGPAEPGPLLTFQPMEGGEWRYPATPPVQPIDLSAMANPIAVESLPDGSCWVLDQPADPDASVLWRFSLTGAFTAQSVVLETRNLVQPDADDLDLRKIRGHDLAYLPDAPTGSTLASTGTLFISDISGNQAYGLRVDLSDGLSLEILRHYYPLRHFTGTALVTGTDQTAYYQQRHRWLPIRALPQPTYEREATIVIPELDGREPGCVWHRLCIDACIPPETELQVTAWAADTREALSTTDGQMQPGLYRRPTGCEIPYASLWSEAEQQRPDTGTWELLFQHIRGRYLQLRLTLVGNGRSTPTIRALRVHYPRFSYLKQYLPAVYQQDPASMQLLENFLANPEGLFTTLEGLIAQVQYLLDVRTIPTDTLDWLVSWVGLALESGWTDYQRRLLLAQAPYFCLRRGTLPGVMQAILLTVHPELGPDIFRDDIAQTNPTVRIVEQFWTRTLPGVVVGDPTELALSTTDDVAADAGARAHRFTVMLPTTVDANTERLVRRIVALEKPAHTRFEIKRYWALFRVGEVRLGFDTILGQGSGFDLFRLGQTALAAGALGTAFPYTLTTRTVVNH